MRLPRFPFFNAIACASGIPSSIRRLRSVVTAPLYRNAFYLMLNTAATSFLGFFFWIIVARLYTEAEVGFGSAIISVMTLLGTMSLVGLNTSLIRFLPRTDRPRELINSCLTLSGLVSLLLTGMFAAGLGYWSPVLAFITQNAIFACAFMIFTLLSTLSALVDAAFVASRRASFVLCKNTINSLIKIPLPVFFALFLHAFGVVASWGIAIAAALAIALFIFLPRVQSSYRPVPVLRSGLLREMWRYSAGSYLANLISALRALLLPVMVVNVLGAEANAYFYIAWMIANLLFTIPSAVSHSLFAEGSHSDDVLRRDFIRSLKFTFLLLTLAVIVLVVVGKWLLLAFGQSYSLNALRLLWVLSFSSPLLAISQIYSAILRVRSRLKELIAIQAFTSTVALVASYLLMPTMGIVVVGYVWIGVHGIIAIYVGLILHLRPLDAR